MGSEPSAWVFPGGHIEVDEGLDEGSLRKFFEETGVKIETKRFEGSTERMYTYAGQDITVTPFYAFEAESTAHLVIFLSVSSQLCALKCPLNFSRLQSKPLLGSIKER